MRRKRMGFLRGLLFPAAAVATLVCFAAALNYLNNGRGAHQLHQVEQAVRRACAACYAAEGMYPPSLAYLQEHYGIAVDARYTVHYTVFAENLMPDITVLENES